jgi:hypothetical protein
MDFCLILVTFGATDLHIMLFNISEFRGTRCRADGTFLTGVNAIIFMRAS